MEIFNGYDYPTFKVSVLDIERVMQQMDDLHIVRISSDCILNIQGNTYHMCDKNNPITFVNNHFFYNNLCINEDFYKSHLKEASELVLYICRNTKESVLKIDEAKYVSDEVIEAILGNPNIEEVTLGSNEEKVILTDELYQKFKNSHIKKIMTYGVEDSLKETFDPIIGYNCARNLIGYSNYEALITSAYFSFSEPLTEEEIFYLKFIKEDAEVNIKIDNYSETFKIIDRLRSVGHTGKIRIDINEKNKLNEYIFGNINSIKYFDNIEVYLSGSTFDLATYIKYEKKLIDLILPAINLSPFEKYLFAYNVTKKFKKYKENEEDKSSARNLYEILDNEYMVCVGYSKLLGDLLDKLGIPSSDYSVSVDVGLDDISEDTIVVPDYIVDKNGISREVMTKRGGHARRRIHLVDPKYGIDGYYVADPTWDNEMNKDTYNYALMSIDEYIATDRYNYFNIHGIEELFFSHSLEEFYEKINVLLRKRKNHTEKDIIRSLLFYFKEFDVELYSAVKDKYPDIERISYEPSFEVIQDVFLDIGEHIINRSNNIVGGELFKEGIIALYRYCYGITDSEELETTVNEVMEYNKRRHESCFPTRYKIDKNDNKLVLFNIYNKFDIDGQPKLGV